MIRATSLCLLLAAACSSPMEVKSSHSPDADFKKLKTYSWRKPTPTGDPRIDDARVERFVKAATDAKLAGKGFRRVEKGADFQVYYFATILRGQSTGLVDKTASYGGWGGGVASPVWLESYDREYTNGTLILDITNPKKELLWRAYAWTEINFDKPVDDTKAKEEIDRAVALMMDRFPPKP